MTDPFAEAELLSDPREAQRSDKICPLMDAVRPAWRRAACIRSRTTLTTEKALERFVAKRPE